MNGQPAFPALPAWDGAPGDRAALSHAFSSRPMQQFLLGTIRIPSCTLGSIDCIRVLDNAEASHRILDDVLIDRLFTNLDGIFTALASEEVDDSLARCAEEALQLAQQFAAGQQAPPIAAVTEGAVTPLTTAVRLTRISARVLPEADRARYDEEWQSELYELALHGASRWVQLLHALRILNDAWVLRAELKAPTPQRARR